jgi:3-phosphoshikimate 1-carboxyvinyltransferase
MRRPHGVLLRCLERLGAHIKRRSSGAVRVLSGGVHGERTLNVDIARSSQYASALLLLAPRIGGLTVELASGASSRAYVRITERVLEMFGVPVEASETRIHVPPAVPEATGIRVEADASAAACWRAAAALTGGTVTIPGLAEDSAQPDAAIADVIRALAQPQRAPLDLRDCSDLVFLAGVLAAVAEGETRITGVAHTRRKESDRVAVLVRGLQALGAHAGIEADDSIRIRGGALRGTRVDCAGDHRAAIAFGVLGLRVPGVVLGGAQCVSKSQPTFLADLARAARSS